MPTTPPVQPPAGTAGQSPQDRVNQLMASGYTGQMINPATGQMQTMTNGQWAAAPAAQPAATPPTPGGYGGQGPGNPGGSPTDMAGYLGQVGGYAGPAGMAPWASWMASGGANPAGWQQLGGGPDSSFFQTFQNYLNGGANPTQVSGTSAQDMQSAAQPYADQAYQASMRELQPQLNQQNAQFQQQMISQGIAPGSAAYQQAQTALSQQQNDAVAQARQQAQQQGLAAQAQGFGQGLSQSQLASQLAGQLLGANTSFANQQLGGNASIMNALLGGNSGIAQQLIGASAQRDAANASAAASRANAQSNYRLGEDQLAQSGQNADFANLISLLGLGSGVTSYNNGLLNQNQQNAMQFLGYMPQGGSGSIDAQSPYNNQYQGNMNQWNYANQQANAENQAGMSLAMMALLCDRNAKDTIKTFDVSTSEVLRGLPVDFWRYKNGPDRELHVGTYAQEFNRAIGKDVPRETIQIVDMLGFMLAALKEQAAKLDKIESRLAVAGA